MQMAYLGKTRIDSDITNIKKSIRFGTSLSLLMTETAYAKTYFNAEDRH